MQWRSQQAMKQQQTHAATAVLSWFILTATFSKLWKYNGNDMDTVKMCQDYFNFELPSSRGDRLL